MRLPVPNPRQFIIWLVLLALVLGLFLAPWSGTIRAQSNYTWDFTVSDGGWTGFSGTGACPGTYSAGVGWVEYASGTCSQLEYDLPPGAVISSIAVQAYVAGFEENLEFGITTGTQSFCAESGWIYCLNKNNDHTGGPSGVMDWNLAFSPHTIGSGEKLRILNDSHDAGGIILSITLEQIDFFTPTPTGTPLPPTATLGYFNPDVTTTPQAFQTCAIPDTASAVFQPGHQWTFAGGADYAIPSPPRWLDLPPGGSASMSANLTGAEYRLSVIYQSSGLGGGSFIASVGGQPYTVLPTDSAEHTFESEPIKYPAGSTALEISKPASDAVNVTIKSFCLNPVQGSAAAPALQAGTNGNNDQCTTCDPPLSVTDIPGILNWIICNLRRLVTCYFLPLLSSVFGFIGTILKFILSFFAWSVKAAGDIGTWAGNLIGSIWQSITGWISNLFAGVSNSFHTSGLADDTNIIASRTRDLPTAITNGIASFSGQFHDIFFEPAANILDFVVRLVGFAASLIANVLGLIPLVIQSLIDGINSSSTPISGSSVCSDPNALVYFPCLGFYLLDNTLFQGPAGYLIPVLIAVIVFDQITWAFTRIKEELTK